MIDAVKQLDERTQAVVDFVKEAEQQDPSIGIECAKIAGLAVGYSARWGQQKWRAIEKEQPFRLPIVNPETGARSRTFSYIGIKDGVVEGYGKRCGLEHKTTSDNIEDHNGPYWRRIQIDSQVSMYALANWQEGQKLDGTLYDVIKKPTIRPKKLSKSVAAEIHSEQEYCGFPISQRDPFSYAAEVIEDSELFFYRVARECLDEPQKYFQRRVIQRLDNELVEFAHELWDVSQDIRKATAAGQRAFYRNSNACMEYNRACEFLGICSGCDSSDSDNWQPRQSSGERLDMEDDGLSNLSHSAIKTFQTCRRKYYHRYVEGIEKRNDEPSEALYFGSLFHTAMEIWWNFSEVEDGNNSHGSTDSEFVEQQGV